MKRFRFLTTLIFVSFVLHFVWESLHISLYGGYEGLSPYLPITVWAAIGDVFYTILVVIIIAFFKRGCSLCRLTDARTLGVFAFLGFLVALFVEYKALLLERWYYLPAMPIIPFLDIGLSPVLQMTLLLPLSVFLAGRISKRNIVS